MSTLVLSTWARLVVGQLRPTVPIGAITFLWPAGQWWHWSTWLVHDPKRPTGRALDEQAAAEEFFDAAGVEEALHLVIYGKPEVARG